MLGIASVMLFCSCVGQVERTFPWEEEPSGPGEVTDGERSFMILDFTATWCVNCPAMADAISSIANKLPVIPISVHYADEFDCADSRSLVERFKIYAYPTAVVDFDGELSTSSSSADVLKMLCEQAEERSKTEVGIKLSSTLENNVCDVTATLSFVSSGTYSVGAMLLENGLIAPQTGRDDKYVHNHVLKRILAEKTMTVSAGEEHKTNFKIEMEPGQAASNLEVVIYVEAKGVACNSSVIVLN